MFESEKHILQKRLIDQQWLVSGLLAFGVSAIAAPVINPRSFSHIPKLAIVGAGIGSAIMSLEQIEKLKQTQQLFKAVHGVQVQRLESRMTTENGLSTITEEFDRKEMVIREILRRPVELQPYLAAMAGIPLPQPPAPPPEPVELSPTEVALSHSLSAVKNQIPEIDLSYIESIDAEGRSWLERPALVVGPPRSGKSSILSYRASAFLVKNPDGQLWVGDINFSPLNCKWFPGVSPELLEDGIIATNAQDVYRIACEWDKEFRDRRANRDYNRPWLKLMIDEANDTLKELSKGQREHLVQIIEGGSRQGPKYKCSIDIGLHNMKKEDSSLDSSTLRSMDWYLLGNTICDTTIKFPRNFNLETLMVEWQMLGDRVPNNVARPLIFWGHQEPFPSAELVPYLEPPPVKLSIGNIPETETRDWQEYLKQATSNDDWWQRYNEYLKSPEWEAKRQQVLQRDSFKCRECGCESKLQVHHLSYDRVGNELSDDLLALCEPCHKKVHQKK